MGIMGLAKKTTRYQEKQLRMMRIIADINDQTQSEALREALDHWLNHQYLKMDSEMQKMYENIIRSEQ